MKERKRVKEWKRIECGYKFGWWKNEVRGKEEKNGVRKRIEKVKMNQKWIREREVVAALKHGDGDAV